MNSRPKAKYLPPEHKTRLGRLTESDLRGVLGQEGHQLNLSVVGSLVEQFQQLSNRLTSMSSIANSLRASTQRTSGGRNAMKWNVYSMAEAVRSKLASRQLAFVRCSNDRRCLTTN